MSAYVIEGQKGAAATAGVFERKAAGGGASILDKEGVLRSQEGKRPGGVKVMKAVKCKCNKAWCPSCSKKTTVKDIADYMKDWDWRYVRHIVLTIDRRKFESGEQAWEYVTKKKRIAALMRDLERTQGITIHDWQWVLEWHKDGFPHWHVTVLVDKRGRFGQIGGVKIRHYWKIGGATEGYIKNEKHWRRMTGYFEKHGYFEKKGGAHQAILPQWARGKVENIRRRGRKAGKREVPLTRLLREPMRFEDKTAEEKVDDLGEWFERQSKEVKTQGQVLDACGAKTEIYEGTGFGKYIATISVYYSDFVKTMKGRYQQGKGFVFSLEEKEEYPAFLNICNILCST